MNYILFDDHSRNNLLPLTFSRPVAAIRIGILTIAEKWEKYFNTKPSYLTQKYLNLRYKLIIDTNNLLINGSVCPNAKLFDKINALREDEMLVKGDVVIALNASKSIVSEISTKKILLDDLDDLKNYKKVEFEDEVLTVQNLWDIFSKNGQAIAEDFTLLVKGRISQPISSTNQVIAPQNIFLEEGAKVECAILNAKDAFIYIGKDAEIMEGSIIRGSLALCEHSQLKLGAKIYGPTTIGPHSKVGGEVNNSVIFGYSNKAHDGFLGNAVLGEWCNIGADSNNSNLKNDYSEVKIWDYTKKGFKPTGLQFCGLIMADHSKCGINTMFNTGTVVGFSANIFGSGFPRNFIPSFSWGGAAGFTTYKVSKAMEVAKLVMSRRNVAFDEAEQAIFEKVFELDHFE
jgi:UDP-N-acetylglucosamine diphosphorylase/glucosamine-1-phosphate N-acetyltransferase